MVFTKPASYITRTHIRQRNSPGIKRKRLCCTVILCQAFNGPMMEEPYFNGQVFIQILVFPQGAMGVIKTSVFYFICRLVLLVQGTSPYKFTVKLMSCHVSYGRLAVGSDNLCEFRIPDWWIESIMDSCAVFACGWFSINCVAELERRTRKKMASIQHRSGQKQSHTYSSLHVRL